MPQSQKLVRHVWRPMPNLGAKSTTRQQPQIERVAPLGKRKHESGVWFSTPAVPESHLTCQRQCLLLQASAPEAQTTQLLKVDRAAH